MKKLFVIILGVVFLVCSFLVIPNISKASSYTTPETLQNRIDYSLRIIWGLQTKYRSSNFSQLMLRMNPRDKQIYLSALRVYHKAKMDYSKDIVQSLQRKYGTTNYNQLMNRMNGLDKQILSSALRDYKKSKDTYNFLLKNRW
jgi:hypothetical protein